MGERLVFRDAYAASDMVTFAQRAARAGDASVHLKASGGVLVTTAAPLVRQGLLDATPTILGVRILPVDPELECDLVVEAVLLQIAYDDPTAVQLPDTAVEPPLWSQAPLPRRGWVPDGELSARILSERAQWGMSAVAHALPLDPGDPIVHTIRGHVWNAPDEDLGMLPRGVAFVASTLGFLGDDDEQVPIRRCDRWVRLSLSRGHVCFRGPAHTGMTGVRDTGMDESRPAAHRAAAMARPAIRPENRQPPRNVPSSDR